MRNTLILGAIVAGLVAFSLFDYKKAKKEAGLGEREQKLLSLTEGEVRELSIRSSKIHVQLKSEDANWRLIEPLKDDADDVAVISLLNAIKNAKAQSVSDETTKNIEWAKYGLSPGAEIELVTDQGQHDKFSISEANAYDGSFYVRKGDQLLIGDRGLARISDLEIKNLRSHLIWRAKTDPTNIEVSYTYLGEAKHAVLTKGEKEWSVEPKYDLPLSQENIKDWLQSIRDLRANDVIGDVNAKTLEQFGLKKPSMKITFNKDNIWTFGADNKNEVYITNSQLPIIFKSSKFSLRDVRIPVEQLLNANPALIFALEQANAMEVTTEGKKSQFAKGEKSWDKLPDFFQKLKGLEPIAAEPPAGVVLDAKKNHLIIKGQNGVLLELIWSDVKDQLRWLKISNFKERFKVSAERWAAQLKAAE
jgi:hypothetical protein